MATKKITITLPEELVEAARGLTDNLSGYAADALAFQIRNTLLGLDLEDYQRAHGRFDQAELDAARAELFGVGPDVSAVSDATTRPDLTAGAA